MVMCAASARLPLPYCSKAEDVYGLYGVLFFWMHAKWSAETSDNGMAWHRIWGGRMTGIHLYDSMAFLTRGPVQLPMNRVIRGSDRLYGT